MASQSWAGIAEHAVQFRTRGLDGPASALASPQRALDQANQLTSATITNTAITPVIVVICHGCMRRKVKDSRANLSFAASGGVLNRLRLFVAESGIGSQSSLESVNNGAVGLLFLM